MARKPATDAPLGTDDLFNLMDKEFSKKFRTNPAKRLSEYRKDMPKLWYSTGILSLDIALGGGLAGGRMSEWFGLEGSGKSTLLYSAIAEAQRRHPEGFHDYHVIADPENSSSDARKHMELIGVDTSKVHIIAPQDGKPLYAEDIFERIEFILRHPQLKGRIGIIGIDSVGALVSKTEGESNDKWDKAARVGGISGVMSMFLRNVVDSGLLYESDAHLLLLNQVRDNINGSQFDPFRTPGRNFCHPVA
jgi:recombination protein RecA